MANLQNFGNALNSIGQALMMTDPRYAGVVQDMQRQKMAEEEFKLRMQDRQREQQRQDALKSFASTLTQGPVNLDSALAQYASASGDPSALFSYLMQKNDPARQLQMQTAQLQLQQARNEQQRQSALAALFSGQQSPNGVPIQQGVMGPVQPTALKQLSPLEMTRQAAAIAPEQFMDNYLALATAKPEERKTASDVNGVLRYVDTGQEVFPGVAQDKPPQTTGLPEGYKWENGEAVPIEGITPGKLKPTAESEKARKLAEEAIENLNFARTKIYDDKGGVNRGALWQTYTFGNPVGANPVVQWGEAREISQPMERAIQNAIYLKTGATATPSEIEGFKRIYMPSKYDSDEQVKNKLDSLEMFLKSNAPEFGGGGTFGGALQNYNSGWSIREK